METSAPALGIGGIAIFLFAALVGIGAFIFWIWTLIDALKNEEGNEKILWVLVIVLTGVIGSLIYLFMRMTKR